MKMMALTALSATAVVGAFALPAQATQLQDHTNSVGCSETFLSATQKIQACEVVQYSVSPEDPTGSYGSIASASADATAYKKAGSTWVKDTSVKVSVDAVSLTIDGHLQAGQAYPSGPQSGYANGSTRGFSEIDRSTVHTAFAKASFGVWKNGSEVKSIAGQQSPTTTFPVGYDTPVDGGYSHPNQYGSLACTNKTFDATHLVRACVDGGLTGGADVTSYKKVNGQWVHDTAVLVSVDSVSNYIDGSASGGMAYPSGPQAGYAQGATRGFPTVDPSVSHQAYATAKIGLWKSTAAEKITWTITSNSGTIPAA